MSQNGISRRARGALSAAVAAGVLVPTVLAAGTAHAAPGAAAAPKVVCTSAKAGLADKLTKDITAALRGRPGTVAVGLNDPATKTVCTLRGDQRYDSASTVKVTVLATLLWDAKKSNRKLTERESRLATAMITRSDNASTTALWRQLGTSKVKGFLKAAGMTRTTLDSGGAWGLTQINVRDEQKLLSLLTTKNNVLSDNARAYILKLMNKVVADQRWGTPAGAPSSMKVHVKNGWLPRDDRHVWRVHSLGAFTGGGRTYTMTVLTHDVRTQTDGINAIQAVARVVHKDLNPGAKKVTLVPTRTPEAVIPPVGG
ncbi:class A beta-lactamase-related serine hydrolase [Streptomyces sp. LX-29]|uniref:serine hydrolase n=1 Tax=Streptomyces sp. LX-29 TaxID=2900152 RepID=UPI00240E3BF8|nr:serine hydrolase [Streptomyces sp. LX-29]WFB08730.1 class A beta-lactamase-related serine hydrolase [Streptomyces sp. LX-29]